MKNITIITEQASDESLARILPRSGVASVTVTRNRRGHARTLEATTADTFLSFRNPLRFNGVYRVELTVEDSAVEPILDAISFAHGAGVFGDAEVLARR